MPVEGNGHDHEPVEVELRVDDEDADYPLKPGNHGYNLGQTLQKAVDVAVDRENWGDGPHTASVQFAVEFKKVNPGDIGAYKVIISEP